MFQPGEAFQFDFSHEDVEIAGQPMRVKVAHKRTVQVRAYADRIVVRCAGEVVAEHARCFATTEPPRAQDHHGFER
jgi:uncharacterized protein (DUF427 family)